MSQKELKRLLIRYCYWYYVKNQPLVSDRQYDELFKKLQKMETEYDPNSPTQRIYGDQNSQYPEWAKKT